MVEAVFVEESVRFRQIRNAENNRSWQGQRGQGTDCNASHQRDSVGKVRQEVNTRAVDRNADGSYSFHRADVDS